MFPNVGKESLSVHYESGREPKAYVVRWREAGRNRTKRFATESEALAYERERTQPPGVAGREAGDE